MTKNDSSIRLSKRLIELLRQAKRHPRETHADVIEFLLKEHGGLGVVSIKKPFSSSPKKNGGI